MNYLTTLNNNEIAAGDITDCMLQELIKNGNLDKQIPMKQYIEWPDEHLAYDKKLNEWITIKPY